MKKQFLYEDPEVQKALKIFAWGIAIDGLIVFGLFLWAVS